MGLRNREGRVTVRENVVVGRGGGRELQCDVYVPPNQERDAPAVLLVHGGSWVRGDRQQLRGYGILLARKGFVCVACEYRLSGEAIWPAQIYDVKTALRWMRANAEELGIDPERIAVSGNSAGGHLALMLAGTPHVAEFEGGGGHADQPTHVAGVVAIYPPTRMAGDAVRESVIALMGPDAQEDAFRAASPITYAAPDFPPTLLIHGNQDELVPVGDSFAMYRALIDAGAGADLHIYNGAPHAFDIVPELGRQCAELQAVFLDRHVVTPRPVVLPGPMPGAV